ncbi:hypothetical protein CkaCkLH20_12187 [Colletotrichum karsti]|uniref:NAD(P)-binding domain-containing protein n=1 Tax=Colletotrichum karsti TaxID=1095194 RepID=A0A9P6I1T0_9PEZI|nr:uncharacterized protein CkaCkLH20_12187 [Colletotrichum karsti]KAF9870340.1 hypothetical protein CkaCkLH20_12187 [Colletotrichum karsti]
MAKDSILVLGGTGPAGICLLRELVFRNLKAVAFARTPSKIPADLTSNPLIKVVKGGMDDAEALSTALSECHTVVSLLGPNASTTLSTGTEYPDMYRTVLSAMRRQGVRRIFAMGTVSIYQPEDETSILRWLMATLVRLAVHKAWLNFISIQKLFEGDREATRDIDWTVYRIGFIQGGGEDAKTWAQERDDGKTFAGPVGASGWGLSQKRAALTRWLVDVAETGAPELIGKMPAVSKLN